MSPTSAIFDELFATGALVLKGPPASPCDAATLAVLRSAFQRHRLSVAGPLVDFDPETAVEAAELLRWSAWLLVSRTEPIAEVERRIRSAPPKRGAASSHLSADLLLRHLPAVHHRAAAIAPDDPLALRLAEIFRAWPLSGVLSTVTDRPTTAPEFGHPGLALLYAERLLQNDKPHWHPEGPGAEPVAWVFAHAGRGVPAVRSPSEFPVGKGPKGSEEST